MSLDTPSRLQAHRTTPPRTADHEGAPVLLQRRALRLRRSAMSGAASTVRIAGGSMVARWRGCRFRLRPSYRVRRLRSEQRAQCARIRCQSAGVPIRRLSASCRIHDRLGSATSANRLQVQAAKDAPRKANPRAALRPAHLSGSLAGMSVALLAARAEMRAAMRSRGDSILISIAPPFGPEISCLST